MNYQTIPKLSTVLKKQDRQLKLLDLEESA